jgi:hypothetical protein
MAVDWPAIGVPPDMEIFVVLEAFGFGVELREDWADLGLGVLERVSPTRKPADEACCFGCGLDALGPEEGGVAGREALLLLGPLDRFELVMYSRSLAFLL